MPSGSWCFVQGSSSGLKSTRSPFTCTPPSSMNFFSPTNTTSEPSPNLGKIQDVLLPIMAGKSATVKRSGTRLSWSSPLEFAAGVRDALVRPSPPDRRRPAFPSSNHNTPTFPATARRPAVRDATGRADRRGCRRGKTHRRGIYLGRGANEPSRPSSAPGRSSPAPSARPRRR